MVKMKNITNRLIAMVVLPLLAIAGIGLQASYDHYTSMKLNDKSANAVVSSTQTLRRISSLISEDQYLIRSAAMLDKTVKTADQSTESTLEANFGKSIALQLEKNLEDTANLWDRFHAGIDSAEEKALADKFAMHYQETMDLSTRPAIIALKAVKLSVLEMTVTQSSAAFAQTQSAIDSLIDLNTNPAKYAAQQNNESASRFKKMLLGSIGIFSLLVVILALLGLSIFKLVSKYQYGSSPELNTALSMMARGETEHEYKSTTGDRGNGVATLNIIRTHIEKLASTIHALEVAIRHGNSYSRAIPGDHVGQFRTITEAVNSMLDAMIDRNVQANSDSQTQISKALMQTIEEINEVIVAAQSQDMSKRISLDGKTGEIEKLCNSLNLLLNSTSNILETTKSASSTMSEAAREISDGGTGLSKRTEEQAATLVQTASNLEELATTVKQNADQAKQANLLAIDTSIVALKGGDVIRDVVTTMSNIFSDAQKIEEIVSVIDSIAFQSNILALNAAVEAAKAGEHGRGFSTVAVEVRNLAEQSAAAVKKIKELIIESTTKTTEGRTQIEHAGTTIQEIVYSAKRVSDIIAQISSVSIRQSEGIDQINSAMTQMDGVTQHNLELVEKTAKAAASLTEQAQVLVASANRFRQELDGLQQVTVNLPLQTTPALKIDNNVPGTAGNQTDSDWELF